MLLLTLERRLLWQVRLTATAHRFTTDVAAHRCSGNMKCFHPGGCRQPTDRGCSAMSRATCQQIARSTVVCRAKAKQAYVAVPPTRPTSAASEASRYDVRRSLRRAVSNAYRRSFLEHCRGRADKSRLPRKLWPSSAISGTYSLFLLSAEHASNAGSGRLSGRPLLKLLVLLEAAGQAHVCRLVAPPVNSATHFTALCPALHLLSRPSRLFSNRFPFVAAL